MLFGVFIKEQGLDALLSEEVALCREIFSMGVAKQEIHKGILQKEGDDYFVENGGDKIFLHDGDKIMFRGWERVFRKSI